MFRTLLVVLALAAPALSAVRVTYLGTNGYLLEAPGATLLVDPYFTRISLGTAALNAPMQSSPERVAWAMRRLPVKIDAIFVTHGHFDHLLDVPAIAKCTGARVFASRSSVFLAGRGTAMKPGEQRRIGTARITALAASHDRIFGCIMPFPGNLDRPRSTPPRRPGDWVCGEPLAFLIEMGGCRIYVDSGGTPAILPPRSRVDLAILGVALPDSRKRLAPALAQLRPRYFLPSHQDDFFRPLDRGFVFGPLTDFPQVKKTAQRSGVRMIMLDYFRPWTLR